MRDVFPCLVRVDGDGTRLVFGGTEESFGGVHMDIVEGQVAGHAFETCDQPEMRLGDARVVIHEEQRWDWDGRVTHLVRVGGRGVVMAFVRSVCSNLCGVRRGVEYGRGGWRESLV